MNRRTVQTANHDTVVHAQFTTGEWYGTGFNHTQEAVESGLVYFQPTIFESRTLVSKFAVGVDSKGDGVARIGVYGDTDGKPDRIVCDLPEFGVGRKGTIIKELKEPMVFRPGVYWLAFGFVGRPTPVMNVAMPIVQLRAGGKPSQVLHGEFVYVADYQGGNLPPEALLSKRSRFAPSIAFMVD